MATHCHHGRVPVDDELRTVYGYGHWFRVVALTAAVAGVLAYLAATVALFVSGDTYGGVLAAVTAVPGVAFFGYVWLWHRPYRLELSGDAILWYTPLARGRMPVKLLYRIERGAYLRPGAEPDRVKFRPFSGPTLSLPLLLNLGPFIQSVLAIEPRIEVLPDGWARAIGALPPD
jgi:hypothetical protein